MPKKKEQTQATSLPKKEPAKRKAKKKTVAKKRAPKQKRIKEKVYDNTAGLLWMVWVNPPEELIPKEEHIGQFLEVAGEKNNRDFFKFRNFETNKDNEIHGITVLTNQGQFRSFRKEACILHRNEKVRLEGTRSMGIISKKVGKKMKRKKRG